MLPKLPGDDWTSHEQTLVLALRQGCSYCEASMPFYKRLSTLESAGKLHIHLLIVMPDDRELAARQLEARGVDLEAVYDCPLSTIGVSATPTLLLVDAKGRIRKAWIGQLAPAQENGIIAVLEK